MFLTKTKEAETTRSIEERNFMDLLGSPSFVIHYDSINHFILPRAKISVHISFFGCLKINIRQQKIENNN